MRVFISYAREDKATAQRIYNDLKEGGADPWLDEENLLPGQHWAEEIGKAIRECDYFLALLSSRSVSKRGYVQKELKKALDILGEFPRSRIFLIPARLDDCQPIDEALKNLHWVDLFPSYEGGLDKILRVLQPDKQLESWNEDPPILGTKNQLVRIPGGTFMMGDVQEGRFEVTVDTFLMDMYPVTQSLYQEVIGKNPSVFEGDNRPVETVFWLDAVKFCNRLSERLKFEPVYNLGPGGLACGKDKNGFRLPTEAEWEYACRAGTTGARYGPVDEIAWYGKNSELSTQPVGRKKPNYFSLYDMIGNVWEWVWDWYHAYPSEPMKNPSGPDEVSNRVQRGGGWLTDARFCRSAFRSIVMSDYHRADDLGFRLTRSLL